MSVTKRSDLIYTDILQEAVSGAYAGMKALFGTGAAQINTTMPKFGAGASGAGGMYVGGDTIKIPYFDVIGELDDVTEGNGLVPAKLTLTSESSTVTHSGKAGEVTNWAQMTAMFADPYAEYGKQFAEAYARRIDQGLLSKAALTTLINDASAVGPGYITWDAVCDAVALWADEGDIGDVALMVVHSKVMNDLRKLRDSTGRPLLLEASTQGQLPTILGIQVKMSDRVALAAGVYDALICRRGAMAAWVNGQPDVLQDRDVLANAFITAIHTLHVEHMYKRPRGGVGTKPGVVRLKTKAST